MGEPNSVFTALFRVLISLAMVENALQADFAVIENCEPNFDPKTYFYPHQKIHLIPTQLPNPDGYDIGDYKWSYQAAYSTDYKSNMEKTKPFDLSPFLRKIYASVYEVMIPEHSIEQNFYVITVRAQRLKGRPGPLYVFNENGQNYKKCHIYISIYKPLVIITGGVKRTVPPNKAIRLNGKDSFDWNYAKGKSNRSLSFSWSCTHKTKANKFCNKPVLSTTPSLVIPAKMVTKGDVITVDLKVSLAMFPVPNSKTTERTQTQYLHVVENAVSLEIICRKNCAPHSLLTNKEKVAVFAVKCVENCGKVKNENYWWTIGTQVKTDDTTECEAIPDFDYKNKTRFGRSGTKFVTEANTLSAGQYCIQVHLRPQKQKQPNAVYNFYISKGPNVKDCYITPAQGDSLSTDFRLDCEHVPNAKDLHRYFYELIVRDASDPTTETLVIDGFHPYIGKKSFKLPPSKGKIFFVRASWPYYPITELEVKVEVTSSLADKTADEVAQIVDDVYNGKSDGNSVAKLISSENPKDREKALATFQIVVDELIENPSDDKNLTDFIESFKYTAAEDMLNATVQDIHEAVKISQTLTTLANHNVSKKSDPLLAKFVTTVCNKMAQKSLDIMKEEVHPMEQSQKAIQVTSAMSKCALPVTLEDEPDLLAPVPLNITTLKPTIDEPVITENYPNYEDHDDEYYEKMDMLKEATYNVVNVTSIAAKITAMTTAPGEGAIKSEEKTSSTTVLKDSGDELVQVDVRSNGVTVFPSQDFANDDHFYDILMTTWNGKIFWWNAAHTNVPTEVASLEFWHSSCKERVSNFTNPFTVIFEIRENDTTENKFRHSSAIPKGFSSLSTQELNHQVQTHRVVVPENHTLFIGFYASTVPLKVVVTVNKFPTVEDFAQSTTINSTKTWRLENSYGTNVVAYIGILPKEDTSGTTLTYDISFILKMCIEWEFKDSAWIPTCKVKNSSNDTTVQCLCTHASVLAGYIQNLDSHLQVVMKPTLELEFQNHLVIFVTVVVTFCFYFALLLLVLVPTRDHVYFLGDNNTNDRFAYLLAVRTKPWPNSGTSSNVTVRLVGDKRSSEPHLLNYPDPQLRLLQRFGHENFILTTRNHLGDLTKLELWFDSLGPNPAWYCNNIRVYDLQLRTVWYFNVGKRLSLLKHTSHISVEPMQDPGTVESDDFDKIKSRVVLPRRCTMRWKYHTWFLWEHGRNFSYEKKLSLILSIVVTTYAVTLLHRGLPTMELKDGLDEGYRLGPDDVLVGFSSSFLVFLGHILAAWCFRSRLSSVQFPKYREEGEKLLSFICTICCWVVVVVSISLSTTLLVIFGFWVPLNSSLIWLTLCWIGITFDVFVYEVIHIVILNFVKKLLDPSFSIWIRFENIRRSIEMQRRYLFAQFGQQLLRPYFGHLYKPLAKKEIRLKYRALRRRLRVIQELEDLFMFGVYVAILYVVLLSNKNSLIVRGKTTSSEVMEGLHTRTLGFQDIKTIREVYEYINTTLIPSIHPVSWYGNFVAVEPALMIDMANKYLGVARMRQHRMTRDYCKISDMMSSWNLSCFPEFSIFSTETKTFGHRWEDYSPKMELDRMKHIWQYSSEQQSGTLSLAGEFAAYGGGGYIAFLGRTLYNSYANFRSVFHKLWIDHVTRAVFIEFLTYNANWNIFTSIRLYFERSAAGFVYNRVEIHTVRMLFVQNEVELFSIASFFIFLVWVGMLLLKESAGVIKNIRTFYHDTWLMIDLVIVLMSIACIGLFFVRMKLIGNYLRLMEQSRHNEFLSYFFLFYIEYVLTVTSAALVCIATVRLWKMLRFGLMFRMFERTLQNAAPLLGGLGLVLFICVMAFGMTLVLLIGNNFQQIYALMKMCRIIITMTLNQGELEHAEYVYSKVAFFYFILCMVFMHLTKFVFIMIIVKFYLEAQMELSSDTDRYTIKHYVRERAKYIPKLMTYKYIPRLKGGERQSTKVEPKNDKFLYLNSKSLPVNKIKTMSYITQSVLKKKGEFVKAPGLSHYDIKLMLGICGGFLKKRKDVEYVVFYMGRVEGRRRTFVDEARIEKAANVVNLLLQEKLPYVKETIDSEPMECVRKISENRAVLRRCALKLKLILYQLDGVHLGYQKL